MFKLVELQCHADSGWSWKGNILQSKDLSSQCFQFQDHENKSIGASWHVYTWNNHLAQVLGSPMYSSSNGHLHSLSTLPNFARPKMGQNPHMPDMSPSCILQNLSNLTNSIDTKTALKQILRDLAKTASPIYQAIEQKSINDSCPKVQWENWLDVWPKLLAANPSIVSLMEREDRRDRERIDWMMAAHSVCRHSINCIADSHPQASLLCPGQSANRAPVLG